MLNCPFHEDKTPSMQVYPETGTVYCFSANCPTHSQSRPGGSHSLDVIDFIWYKEGGTKHEAIEKAKQLIDPGHSSGNSSFQQPTAPAWQAATSNQQPATNLSRIATLTKAFATFRRGLEKTAAARRYLEERGLDPDTPEAGYNSGKFHQRQNDAFVRSCLAHGLLIPGKKSGYRAFAGNSIVFPLKDKEDRIVSLYFRSIDEGAGHKHFYLKDRQGLYPGYPSKDTKKLILTESVIDAATLLQEADLRQEYSVLALYGTNGFSQEHKEAIQRLDRLEEVILWPDGDEAGEQAAQKTSHHLETLFSS